MGYRYGGNTEEWKGKENSEMETNTQRKLELKNCVTLNQWGRRQIIYYIGQKQLDSQL